MLRLRQARFEELESRYGFGVAPDRLVADLRLADRQKVEILRALAREARVIVMDEPTSSLTADETAKQTHVFCSAGLLLRSSNWQTRAAQRDEHLQRPDLTRFAPLLQQSPFPAAL